MFSILIQFRRWTLLDLVMFAPVEKEPEVPGIFVPLAQGTHDLAEAPTPIGFAAPEPEDARKRRQERR